jgi:copper chaperone CopZ
MHNGLLADPTNQFTRRIKDITSKGSKKLTDADYEERDRLEWEGGLYFDSTHGAYMPSDNIERCVQLGAQKSRIGKDVQAAVFVSDEIVKVQYDGPRDLDEMFSDPRFTLRKGVCIQKSRIIRIRPMIPTGWNIEFTLEYDDRIVNEANLVKAMQDAGALVGLGDWRPKFGRFTVEVLSE